MIRLLRNLTLAALGLGVGLLTAGPVHAQEAPAEAAYYEMITLPIPEDVVLEVGGMDVLPDGRLVVSTRRGEVWFVENPTMASGRAPHYTRFAHGLHEALGVGYRDGFVYAVQRGELTRLHDRDGDGRADFYETVYSWPLEGNYHEYSYGPIFRADGDMLVTLNLAWVGHGASLSKWRGWMLEVSPEGVMTPFATGMRSPAGFAVTPDGEVFYAENQGDWIGSGYITHVERGDFVGNPAGLRWSGEPGVPEALRGLEPDDIPDTGRPLFEVAREVPQLKPPAVWFPHTVMGISTSDILVDTTGGAFGPFEGQLFVGDQGHSKIMRVFLEEVDGVYQGAVFPFREGFRSGVLRLDWGPDGSMYVGQTSRGWSATGKEPYGLQRLVWSGQTPFEVQEMHARPDGFELVFTRPVDAATAADPASYEVTSFVYKYHQQYGSPPVNQQEVPIRGIVVADDGRSARLVLDGAREGYIHEVKMAGVRSREGEALLHDVAYYTLNRIPEGERLAVTGTGSARAASAAAPVRPEAEAGPKRQTEMPASWTSGADVTVTIGTLPGLRFDLPSFEVPPGGRVKLVFNNDDDMLHNLLVVLPGTAADVARQALELGLDGHAMDYVPDSDQVLFHTRLLEPESSDAIYFQAPATPGDYTYVCTFPGHSVTMQGTMRVNGAGSR